MPVDTAGSNTPKICPVFPGGHHVQFLTEIVWLGLEIDPASLIDFSSDWLWELGDRTFAASFDHHDVGPSRGPTGGFQ